MCGAATRLRVSAEQPLLCAGCVDGCVSCTDVSSCDVCDGLVNAGGKCVSRPNAVAQSNGGVTVCDDDFVLLDGVCAACKTVFPECAVCTATGCIKYIVGKVVIDGSCRPAAGFAATDGLSCTTCDAGTRRKSPAECVDSASDTHMVHADGVCLRCANGLFADETGGCQCLRHTTAHPQRATSRARRVRPTRRPAPGLTLPLGCT